MNIKTVGKLIKEARLRKRMTQIQLAVLAEMSPTTISLLEKGVLNSRADTLSKLAKILNLNFEMKAA